MSHMLQAAARAGTPALDLTAERCPMTFVRVRIALDALPAGGTLRVWLRGMEARRNVAISARALGCDVDFTGDFTGDVTGLDAAQSAQDADGDILMTITKATA